MKIKKSKVKHEAPHQTIILLTTEMMEILPDGRVTGIPVATNNKILTLTGKNFEQCLEKTERLLEVMVNETNKINNED